MKRIGLGIIGSIVLTAAIALVGCGNNNAGKPAATNELHVAVPCGQTGPFTKIAKIFRKQNPGIDLKWTQENMVVITEKIVNGQESPDVVMSMGDLELNRMEKAGKIEPGTRTKYAMNALAITVPEKNPGGVTKFEDVIKPAVKKISIPDPAKNSNGMHAIEALKKANLWTQVEGKVTHPTYSADGMEMGQQGQVDVSIGYYPCVSEVHVKGEPPSVLKGIKMIGLVPAQYYMEFSCEAGIVKGSANPEGGKKLIALLQTPEVQEIFKEWNFRRDLAPAPAK